MPLFDHAARYQCIDSCGIDARFGKYRARVLARIRRGAADLNVRIANVERRRDNLYGSASGVDHE